MNRYFVVFLLSLWVVIPSLAHDEDEPIHAGETEGVAPQFDIVFAQVERFGSTLIFHQIVAGQADESIPNSVGELAGASVYSFVWLTSLDSSVVGFEAEQGILALAVTSHPDFDDTPLWDEDEDGDTANDGALWHSHWVVLVEDESCGAGLKVKDIPDGETPAVPDTWPQLPILIDSPNYELELTGDEVLVQVPHGDVDYAENFNFDGVTAGLQVNEQIHAPLLCVTGVDDIASGDLSLPGVSN